MQRSLSALILFVAVITLVVGGLHYYLFYRLVRSPELALASRRWIQLAFVAVAILTPTGIVLARSLKRPAATVLSYIVYGWFGLAVLLFFLLAASELVRLMIHARHALVGQPLDPSRRLFLSRAIAGSVGVLGMTSAFAGLVSAHGRVAVRKVQVLLNRLPRALSGLRIVQLTDLHIGPTLGRSWLESVVADVNALEPDLVVITGDLVDGSVASLREHVAPLANLRTRHGVYFVTGNHEYYSGVDAWIAELTRLGVRVLRNERVSIGDGEASLDLAGVDDYSARHFGGGHGANLDRALSGRDPGRELILLAHQPKQVLEAAKHGVGLQLSGHTHGGQIFPWGFFVLLDQPFLAGLGRLGDTQIYVSRGTGYWGPPMRVLAPAEITVVEVMTA